MNKSIFDPEYQQHDLSSKIIAGLERISQAFKVLLWERAKNLGISPIQIQILIFVAHHRIALNNVSLLAQEFNVSKPTISDAVRVLHEKGLIVKDHSHSDNRSYSIFLSDEGKKIVAGTEDFATPMANMLQHISKGDQESLFSAISKLIYQLNQQDILTVQRTCFACRFYEQGGEEHYCRLLKKRLKHSDIRLDCHEFEAKL
ncbi:MarR family winged helix-turn-helix transcriptional regulator [Flagellimonas meishanensis]|uniref:MarR family winged helix-turn-helix transcriptional regulator n=1 Tax=Flagellimonas meishanensis TaxID=2873264 RepID=UPI001CA7A6CF|nr:MarR family winged helix-turn-helix transcriptional regulator [[Muricauda] meishanensis]